MLYSPRAAQRSPAHHCRSGQGRQGPPTPCARATTPCCATAVPGCGPCNKLLDIAALSDPTLTSTFRPLFRVKVVLYVFGTMSVSDTWWCCECLKNTQLTRQVKSPAHLLRVERVKIARLGKQRAGLSGLACLRSGAGRGWPALTFTGRPGGGRGVRGVRGVRGIRRVRRVRRLRRGPGPHTARPAPPSTPPARRPSAPRPLDLGSMRQRAAHSGGPGRPPPFGPPGPARPDPLGPQQARPQTRGQAGRSALAPSVLPSA